MNEENKLKEERKQAIKEALKEWLDDQFKTFGYWTAKAVAAAALVAVIYFIAKMNGWSPK